jgi:hypothetical protein
MGSGVGEVVVDAGFDWTNRHLNRLEGPEGVIPISLDCGAVR